MIARLRLEERLLAGLGAGLAAALAVRAGPLAAETLALIAATAGFVSLALAAERFDARPHVFRLRLLLAYGMTFFLYSCASWVVPALGLEPKDAWLLAADRALFGTTPAAALQGTAGPAATELLSTCYLGFLAYLHGALAWAFVGPRARVERFSAWVFSAYPLGLAGYFLVPAVGPAAAFPELFTEPAAGVVATALNAWVVANGSSVYDLFPSLHVYVTLVLLAHDRRAHPLRFRLLAPLLPMIVVATLVLRYHYAVDLLAGAALFGAVLLGRRAAGEAPAADASP